MQGHYACGSDTFTLDGNRASFRIIGVLWPLTEWLHSQSSHIDNDLKGIHMKLYTILNKIDEIYIWNDFKQIIFALSN